MPATDPIAPLVDACMRAYAALANAATDDSPYQAARRVLGFERSTQVAVEALRAGLKRLLIEDAEAVLEELEHAGAFGELAAQSHVLGVATDAIQAVIAAGKEES